MAVAPAAGHLGYSLTPTLSKNKKIREENGSTISPVQPPGPGISGGEAQMGLSHLDMLNPLCSVWKSSRNQHTVC